MGATGCENLSTLISTRQGVEAMLDRLHARMSPGSVRTTLDLVRDFGPYCEFKGWPAPPFTAADRPGSNPQKVIVVYTPAELETLLVHARLLHGARWELFLETLISTGRRVGEILGLEFMWLNLTADPPHLHLPTTKNGRQAYIPLSPSLAGMWSGDTVSHLKGAHHGQFRRDPAVYPFPWAYSCALAIFGRYCKRLGVQSRGFHCFRHTRATTMLARGVPIQAVAALLGHASVATTDRIYNHTTALTFAEYAL